MSTIDLIARFSLTSLLRIRHHREHRAAATLAAPIISGTVVSAEELHATIRGLTVGVGDVVAISGWEAVKSGTGRPSLEPGIEAEVVAVDHTEATVMALAAGWTPTVGARVVLSPREGTLPEDDGRTGRGAEAPGRPLQGRRPLSGADVHAVASLMAPTRRPCRGPGTRTHLPWCTLRGHAS